MTDPAFEDLAARDGVWRRATRHAVDADRFAAVREKVRTGMTLGVGAVVTDADGRVLLVREDGRWLAPGGEVEAGETHEQALVREVREETGVTVSVDDLVAVTDVVFEHGADAVHFYFAHYTATPETTALAADPGRPEEEVTAVEWVETVPEDVLDREVVVANR
jgi:ADP-ribose pyrophosphatase YjhB (NUDIX family)